ncbi:MAG: thymidine phosphorylase [Firmicutes bacterium]|nr:thymidine phosphorylase [Bacillota bacterium]MDY5530721.1 thymidine phosphorylase [Pumilibacteraceae bacterium]
MRMYDIIEKKKRGERLSDDEIRFFVRGYSDGTIPDYQASALLMAVCLKGMTDDETTALTLAMRDSGDVITDMPGIKGKRVDKHSTGGVGDKTTLVVAPVIASLGIPVAKMSGRGLGHTGGTIDKLESIQGFNTDISPEKLKRIVEKYGIAVVGQSATLAPADKKMYALRDVTATVDSIPLIASSIMSKKLALPDDCIVLDVKCGSGAFMKTREEASALARLMVGIGKKAGRKMLALVTDMDSPLGNAIGNSLEVIEAINTLKGNGPADFTELCVTLAAYMLRLCDGENIDVCRKKVETALGSGAAFDKFKDMIEGQGGNTEWADDTSLFPKAKFTRSVRCEKDGYIAAVNAENYGAAAQILGAGRTRKEDEIDFAAGILLAKKRGDKVAVGDTIATLFSSSEEKLIAAEKILRESTVVSDIKPPKTPLVLDIIE